MRSMSILVAQECFHAGGIASSSSRITASVPLKKRHRKHHDNKQRRCWRQKLTSVGALLNANGKSASPSFKTFRKNDEQHQGELAGVQGAGFVERHPHIIDANTFTREDLSELFDVADVMSRIDEDDIGKQMQASLHGKIMSTLFYEPSTRTRLSFESAMRRLGGSVITTESAAEFSSAAKGESLQDTIRTVHGYCDVIVLRHFVPGSCAVAAGVSQVPIINAGDGPGQHPTQAMLDTYTIRKELGSIEGKKVALVGDLANGRTARSLASMLSLYPDVSFVFVAPEVVKMRDDVKAMLDGKGVKWEEAMDLKEVAGEVDVLYMTRIQKERFADNPEDYEKAKGKYVVDETITSAMKENSIIMHPLPRLDEIDERVDSDPRAAYFRQAQNGLYVRMALLMLLLKQ